MSSKIDVIVPCFNGGRYLAATLDSVLSQTCPDVRALVVDDGSTDDTREVVERYRGRVDYLYQENAGQAAARNRGILATRAPYVCLLDADDLLVPDALALLRDRLEQRPELDIAHGKTLEFKDDDWQHPRAESWRPFFPWQSYLGPFSVICAVDICSAVFRRRVFTEHGLFPEERALQGCEDWYLWLRALLGGTQMGAIDAVSLLYRQHAGSSSARRDSIAIRESELMRRAVELFASATLPTHHDRALLDVGIRAVALRWLWLGDEERYRELCHLARAARSPGVDGGHLDDAFELGAALGWQLLHLELASRLLELENPWLATVMLLKTRNLRRLRRKAASAGKTSTLRHVVARLAHFETQIALCSHEARKRARDSGLPEHASILSELRYQLGLLALADGLRSQAAEYFERALASNPNFGIPHLGLATCQLRGRQPSAALRSLAAGFRLDPERALEHLLPIEPTDPLFGPAYRYLVSNRRFRRGLRATLGPIARAFGKA